MELALIENTDLNIRKTLGRSLLSSNQIVEALNTYADTIRLFPSDIEAYLVLGDLYLAGDNPSAAMRLYLDAQSIGPSQKEITNRINLAQAELGGINIGLVDPLDDVNLDMLAHKLTGHSRDAREIEIEKATRMLDEILRSSNPADLVAKNLDQIEKMLPALLEVNIRQARAENRDDLATGLLSIQESMTLEPSIDQTGDDSSHIVNKVIERVNILVPDLDNPSPRIQLTYEVLQKMGCNVELTANQSQSDGTIPELMIVSNPHVNPWMLEQMAASTAARIPIIVDLDMDYEQMPLNHPEYLTRGLGLPANARAYTAALLLANLVTTPSPYFSDHLKRSGYRSMYLPDGWSKSNVLWEKSSSRRNTINIGWVGGLGTFDDVLEIRRILIRVIREFPRTQLVIAENPEVFQLFENLPDNRKLFLPEVSQEDFPYTLGQLDILTIPLRNIPFNYSIPDTTLMQAGIKKVVWVASNLPAASDWNNGGLLASSNDEWHTNLRQLVMDEEMRQKLSEAGYRKSQEREAAHLVFYWQQVINEVKRDPFSRGFMTRSREQYGTE